MFWRKAKLILDLKAEIQHLREALARVMGERDSYREIAREAIQVASEKHFPEVPRGAMRFQQMSDDEARALLSSFQSHHLPDYAAPEAKNCPGCSVSVRADSWPQECPACHCVFGFNE